MSKGETVTSRHIEMKKERHRQTGTGRHGDVEKKRQGYKNRNTDRHRDMKKNGQKRKEKD